MKKFNPSQDEIFIALITYLLFKNTDCRDAFEIAKKIGLYKEILHFDTQLEDEGTIALKSWLELGCKVNFAWLEGQGDLDDLVMSYFPLQDLRLTDPEEHLNVTALRAKGNKRWSNDWKKIQAKIWTARSLQLAKPISEALHLSWNSVVTACARDLIRVGKRSEAEEIQALSLDRAAKMITDPHFA